MKEIIYAGADIKQGQSLLRLFDGDEWHFALFDASGAWQSLTMPSNISDKTKPIGATRA